MKRRISLIIGGQTADLDDESLVLFNYTREEMANPTIVKNSYSQTVTLPGTATNNAIFGHYFRLDRVTESSSTAWTGRWFNALRQTPFEIRDERGSIVESGYLKLESVTRKGSDICSYGVSLYGGLGAFFYELTYDEEGNKKTLASLVYGGGDYIPARERVPLTAATVQEAWAALKAGTAGLWQIVNFAPCYNGLPKCKFDADKAVYNTTSKADKMPNLYTATTSEGVDYGPKSDAGGYILLQMEQEHTEWEVQDLRAYLQRPVIRVKAIIEALQNTANTGGWTFKTDIFDDDNAMSWQTDGWMTLPMFDRDNKAPANCTLEDLLGDTDTPAAYLIGWAKMFGCVFVTDKATKTVTMLSRNEFYLTGLTDIGDRIDRGQEFSVAPYGIESRYYVLGLDTYGEEAEGYEERYGRAYGSQTVDTGYEFDAESTELYDGSPFSGAAMALEGSPAFRVFGGNSGAEYGDFENYFCKFPLLGESVTWQLYGKDADGNEVTLDCEPTRGWLSPFLYNADRAGYDSWAKVQLHGADNEAEDGSGVLLFFNGFKDLPTYTQGSYLIAAVTFRLSDDNAAMTALNDGTPCWDFSAAEDLGVKTVSSLPDFSRWTFSTGSAVSRSFDFGAPKEVYVPGVTVGEEAGLYPNYWQSYLTDRLDVDGKVVTCKVDLRGLEVGEGLLRRFWAFDGGVWVLNKISNWSLTTDGPTQCEFVKVKDMANYRGQSEI